MSNTPITDAEAKYVHGYHGDPYPECDHVTAETCRKIEAELVATQESAREQQKEKLPEGILTGQPLNAPVADSQAQDATPETEGGNWPTPKYAQHIKFEGCDCIVLSPSEYEELYESHANLERQRNAEREARHDDELQWRTYCTIEVMIRNPQVFETVKHWEGRAEAAEAKLAACQQQVLEGQAREERLRVALGECNISMQAFTDPEGKMPANTGEFNDLAKALNSTLRALALSSDSTALREFEARVRDEEATQTAHDIEAILKYRSKGEVDTWGFVAAFISMIEETVQVGIASRAAKREGK